MVKTADTSHDVYKPMSEFKPPPGPKCHSKIFVPNGRPGLGGFNLGGRCELSTIGHWADGKNGDGSEWVQDGFVWKCGGSQPKGPAD